MWVGEYVGECKGVGGSPPYTRLWFMNVLFSSSLPPVVSLSCCCLLAAVHILQSALIVMLKNIILLPVLECSLNGEKCTTSIFITLLWNFCCEQFANYCSWLTQKLTTHYSEQCCKHIYILILGVSCPDYLWKPLIYFTFISAQFRESLRHGGSQCFGRPQGPITLCTLDSHTVQPWAQSHSNATTIKSGNIFTLCVFAT